MGFFIGCVIGFCLISLIFPEQIEINFLIFIAMNAGYFASTI
jgi:uncharacterized membrane protein